MSPLDFDADRAQSAHLSHLLRNVSPPPLDALLPSIVPPGTYWSSFDKASFFLSLAHHSRWRPDAIAEEIGSGKTTADISSYIGLLEQHSAREPRQPRRRDTLPSACEVSEDWIEVEESIAEVLLDKEVTWKNCALSHKRAEQLKEMKKTLCADSEGVPENSLDDDRHAPTGRKRKHQTRSQEEKETWEERFKTRKQELADLWKREDLLSCLDERYLKTLESLVRVLEDAEEEEDLELEMHPDGEPQRVLSAQVASSAASPAPSHPSPPAAIGHALPNVTRSVPPNMDPKDDIQIDPSLLALGKAFPGHPTKPHDTQYHRIPSSSDITSQLPRHVPTLPEFLDLSRQTSSRLVHTSRPRSQSPLRIRTLTPSPPLPPELPSNLSPASRRRLRKRLWARRNRARLNGLPVTDVSMHTRKLKTGRKPKIKDARGKGKAEDRSGSQEQRGIDVVMAARSTPGPPDHLPEDRPSSWTAAEVEDGPIRDETEDEGESTDGSESGRKKRRYGWTKLEAVNVDAASLRADGLDLFHLGKLGSMTNLFQDIYATPDQPSEIEEGIHKDTTPALSYPFLRLLRACVSHFIARLVANVILQKEVEARQRWRRKSIFHTGGAQEINSENVHKALVIIGKDLKSDRLFKRLKHVVRSSGMLEAAAVKGKSPQAALNRGSDGSGSSVDSSEPGQTDGDTDSESDIGPGLDPSSRETLPPSFTPQSVFALSFKPFLLPSFGDAHDALLPEDSDETALEKELRAEDKVEEMDREADHAHEHALWAEIGVEREIQVEAAINQASGRSRAKRRRVSPRAAEGESEMKGTQSLRFRQPSGTVKSRVYIDSDEDT